MGEEQLVVARLGPSRRVRMWDSMMSGCNMEKLAVAAPSSVLGVEEEEEDCGDVEGGFIWW